MSRLCVEAVCRGCVSWVAFVAFLLHFFCHRCVLPLASLRMNLAVDWRRFWKATTQAAQSCTGPALEARRRCAKLLLCLCASNLPAASAGSLRLSIWGSVLHIKDCLWSQGEGYWTSSRLRISKSPLISGFISTTGAVLPTTQLSPSGCALHHLQWALAWSKSS